MLGESLMAAQKNVALIPDIVAGLIVGVLQIAIVVSFGALIFSGDLANHLSAGVGVMLVSAILLVGTTTLFSTIPSLFCSIQDSPTAILAVIAMSLAGGSTAQGDLFVTTIAAMALAALFTGVFFIVLGQFKLGNLIRFVPYPVIGGFLAGTGLLIATGAISVMTGKTADLLDPGSFINADGLAKWIPGLVFAVLLIVILRVRPHMLVIPGMLLVSLVLFYGVLLVSGASVSEARHHGWLLDVGSNSGSLWQPWLITDFEHIDWSALIGQAGSLGVIAVVSAMAMLMNTSGLELVVRQDIDSNRLLKVIGLSNLFSGLAGGAVGYPAISISALLHRMGTRTRLSGAIIVAMFLSVLLIGSDFVSYFPNPMVGGMLLFVGLDMVVSWAYDTWFRLPRLDYAVLVVIVLVINLVGFLEGIGIGLALAVLLFVVDYSRINVVKHTLSGQTYRSNVVRPALYQRLLRSKGDWIYILKLQGFIFFGTANKLLDQLIARLSDESLSAPHYVVLDFKLVTGIDSSAILSFNRMKQLAQARGFVLILVSLSPQIRHLIERDVLAGTDDTICRQFSDLDHGIEWCENQAIENFESTGLAARPKTFMKQFGEALPAERFLRYLDCKRVEAGYILMKQGDAPKGLYFIESGQITVQLDMANGDVIRLRRMDAGTIVGESGLYLNRPATATVITDESSVLYHLTVDALQRMEQEEPDLAASYHRFMAKFLVERLAQTTETMQALV
jgi:SulP family sulfate permease